MVIECLLACIVSWIKSTTTFKFNGCNKLNFFKSMFYSERSTKNILNNLVKYINANELLKNS
jgi:hypothetical protein